MDIRSRTFKMGSIFIILLIISGLFLMYKGNDAVAMGIKKKDGILTAEQVKISFDSVSGRIINEAATESQTVKKGDVLMVLDSTDVDHSIEQAIAQIAQLDAQIESSKGTIRIGYAQADTTETQNFRQIDQQKALINSAQATYENKQLDYERKQALVGQGAISRSEMDDAQMALQIAAATVAQQKQALAQLLGGASDTGDTDSLQLPAIEQSRQTLSNKQNDVEALIQQKHALEVSLKELQVQKQRLTLRAPEDGKILKILAKQGEMITANTPVILMESKRYYYDIYVNEQQISNLSEGSSITGYTVTGNKQVEGTIRSITKAPGFADLKMSREKGQTDLSAFQIRIYTESQSGIIPGMTIRVKNDEFNTR
ncbi:HlyD family efflux transporter periplasmic adaptor subunit [Megasphaera paucivorans]|uniref:HlyD family secretion protein n=1 Tax=Megasphaera paucivorans TaxID=349095 RepID=A0A1H0AM67_9FIRM|nr:HlyD family efflux transporter periplasmic adaptor subunit [Megasphaera paucivorans]SDN34672.1 HlyD family secretion protein [Megasphaera paucivorans]